MTKKIRQDSLLLEDLPSTQTYNHFQPVTVLIISLTFYFSIPTAIFWTLAVIYLLYVLLVPLNSEPEGESSTDDTSSRSSTNSLNEPKATGLVALLGESDGIRKLQTLAKWLLPKEKEPSTPEITIVRPSLKQSLSFEGQSLLHRLGTGSKLKWPSIGRRSAADRKSTLISESYPRASLSVPDINANYIEYIELDEVDGHGRQLQLLPQSVNLESQDDGLVISPIQGRYSSAEERYIAPEVIVNPISRTSSSLRRTASTNSRRSRTRSDPVRMEQPFQNVVNIILIRGKHLQFANDYFLRIKLGKLKCKSKIVSNSVTFPYWGEEYNFHLYPECTILEIYLCSTTQSSDQYLEKTAIHLEHLPTDQVHHREERFSAHFTDKRAIELQITVTGGHPKPDPSTRRESLRWTTSNDSDSGTSTDSGFWDSTSAEVKIDDHDLVKGLANLYDVGSLKVKVIEAEDLGGYKLNPFCVVQLMNDKFRTQTEYRTANPRWGKTFEFVPTDILHYLEIYVFNEESRDRGKFLGKAVVPLLEIVNGSRAWYQLKDSKFRHAVRGRLHLELGIDYSWFKAGARAIFTKKETQILSHTPRFQRAHFMRNALRIKALGLLIVNWWSYWNTLITWQYPIRSVVGLIFSFALFFYFEWFHILVAFLLFILKNAIQLKWTEVNGKGRVGAIEEATEALDLSAEISDDDSLTEGSQDLSNGKEDPPETLKEKFQSLQDVSVTLLNILLSHSSIIDKLVTISTFGVPFQTWVLVAVLILIIGLGFRYFFIILLLNEFQKHLRGHNVVGNNEALNVLLRAPDFEELILYKGCMIKDE